MIFITGDTHGDFGRVAEFCDRIPTEKEDVLIILAKETRWSSSVHSVAAHFGTRRWLWHRR